MTEVPGTAEPFLPRRITLSALRRAVSACRGCELYRGALQAVFGEGAEDARIMLVGEVPGDAEDRAGRPFVGPAGRLLDQALAEVGIPREAVYVTNAVKHFKFEQRGKRRIHKKPTQYEINACRPWFEAELKAVRPDIVVGLGATAARALFGPGFRVTQHRGEVLDSPWARWTFATVHPASVLRIPDRAERHAARRDLFADFEVVAGVYRGS